VRELRPGFLGAWGVPLTASDDQGVEGGTGCGLGEGGEFGQGRAGSLCSPALADPVIAPRTARPARAVTTTARNRGNGACPTPLRVLVPAHPNAARLCAVSARLTSMPSIAHTAIPANSTAEGASSSTSGPATGHVKLWNPPPNRPSAWERNMNADSSGEFSGGGDFVDRTRELAKLLRFLGADCRVIIIHGIGGIGKSALANRLVSAPRGSVARVIWVSLTNAPSVADVIHYILSRSPGYQPRAGAPLIEQLIECLDVDPSRVVLDNLEVLLDSERFPRSFRPGYEDYTGLLNAFTGRSHRSSIVVTSRELPTLIRDDPPYVRSIHLTGLSRASGRSFLARRGLHGDPRSRGDLVERYGGNPLALQLAADLISDVHLGHIPAFLESGEILFTEIQELFTEHFERLTRDEKAVLYRLAAARQPLALAEISAGANLGIYPHDIPSVLQRLLRRSLIQESGGTFTMQYLIQELTVRALCEQLTEEVLRGEISIFGQIALADARAPEHVRNSQRRFLAAPIAAHLREATGTYTQAIVRLRTILNKCRSGRPYFGGFGAANVLAVWSEITRDLSNEDLSRLVLNRADLTDLLLAGATALGTDFSDCRFPGIYHYVFGLALSPDADFAAIGQIGGTVIVTEVPTGASRAVLEWETEWIRSLAFAPDGSLLAASDERGRVRIWDMTSGLALDLGSHQRQTRSLAFTADGRWLFSGGEDRVLMRWSVDGNAEHEAVRTLDGEIWSLQAAPAGNLLAMAGDHTCLRVLDTLTSEDLGFEDAEGVSGRSVSFSADGQYLFVGCDDGAIRVWNVETKRFISVLSGHSASVWSITVCQHTLVSGSHDETIRVWDISDPSHTRCTRVFGDMDGPVWPVSAGGGHLVAVSRSSTIRYWDLVRGECLEKLSGGSGAVLALAGWGRFLASGGHDRLVRIWDVEQGRCIKELQGHWAGIRALAVDPSGTRLASAGEDWDVRIWDLRTGEQAALLHGARNWLWALAFDSGGAWIATGGADLVIRLWPLDGGGRAYTLPGHPGRVRALAFTDDDSALWSCGEDGQVRLWDLEQRSSAVVGTVGAHQTCLVVTPDGSVVTGSADGRIRRWDRGGELSSVAVHLGSVLSLLMAADGQSVISGGSDGMIYRWSLPDFQRTPVNHESSGTVRALALCSNGERWAAAGADETIRLFGESDGMLRTGRRFEGLDIRECRGLTDAERITLRALGAVEEVGAVAVPEARPVIADRGQGRERRASMFISYAHDDEGLRAELDKHLSLLRYRGVISDWQDRRIMPGAEWEGEIDENLEQAEVILLLISADFLASPYCRDIEMRRAMERHSAGSATVIPVILRDCDWQGFPFGALQSLPRDGRSVRSWGDSDAAFTDVATWIRKTVDDRIAEREESR
jgi:WD40 repeat protein